MDVLSLLAGLAAYLCSVLLAVVLVFGTYRLSTWLTPGLDEQRLVQGGNRSVALVLGAVVLSQSILLRHAVFPTMVVVRGAMLRPFSWGEAGSALAQAVLFVVVTALLSVATVAVAAWLFTRMTRGVDEFEEIRRDNLAVALLFALVLLGIALVVNEGLEELSRSLVPVGRTGFLRLS
jgi:uncharacterized membrane protein YjfL (UPF0719 family)